MENQVLDVFEISGDCTFDVLASPACAHMLTNCLNIQSEGLTKINDDEADGCILELENVYPSKSFGIFLALRALAKKIYENKKFNVDAYLKPYKSLDEYAVIVGAKLDDEIEIAPGVFMIGGPAFH